VVSWFASTLPEVLERYTGDGAAKTASPVVQKVDDWRARYALLPDYTIRKTPLGASDPVPPKAPQEAVATSWANVSGWGSLAGLIGTAVTLVLVRLAAAAITRRKAIRPSQT
jgi:hypothetical protein